MFFFYFYFSIITSTFVSRSMCFNIKVFWVSIVSWDLVRFPRFKLSKVVTHNKTWKRIQTVYVQCTTSLHKGFRGNFNHFANVSEMTSLILNNSLFFGRTGKIDSFYQLMRYYRVKMPLVVVLSIMDMLDVVEYTCSFPNFYTAGYGYARCGRIYL